MVKITPISSFKTLCRCLYASFLALFLGTILSSSWRVTFISCPLSKGCPFEKTSSSLLISAVIESCLTSTTGAHSLFSLASGMCTLSSFFGSVHIPGKAENMEFNNICNISYLISFIGGLGFFIPIFVISEIRVMGHINPIFFISASVRRLSPSRIRLPGHPSSVFHVSVHG